MGHGRHPGCDPGTVYTRALRARSSPSFSATMISTVPSPSTSARVGTPIDPRRGSAAGALRGRVPGRDEALALADDALIERLTALRGIGRWTVDMLLMFTLERGDILPADDFGVRDGYRRLKSLDALPTARQIAALGAAWAPHRSAASWYLWRVPK